MSSHRLLRLLVMPLVRKEDLNDRDQQCPGVYQAQIPVYWSDEKAVHAMVEAFHHQITPVRPDDFTFQVLDGERMLQSRFSSLEENALLDLPKLTKMAQARHCSIQDG